MIRPLYLTHYKTALGTTTEWVESGSSEQLIRYDPETYAGIETGLRYPPLVLLDKVVADPVLASTNKKTAVIFCAGNVSFSGLKSSHAGKMTSNYRFLSFTIPQIVAGRMAQCFGSIDSITTDASACSSGSNALMTAQVLATLYGFERFILIAVEDQVNDFTMRFFQELQAVFSKSQEDAGLRPSAFDSKNYGMYLGQGAVCMVLETEAADYHATLLGAYTAAEESVSAVGQREDGQGFIRASSEALKIAGVSTNQVDIVKTHGTGTKSNNIAESAALSKLLGDSGYVATSFKPSIGHTLGASALLELCLLLDAMRDDKIVPAIANRTELDRTYLSEPVAVKTGSKIVLNQSAGMGNVYSSSVWRV